MANTTATQIQQLYVGLLGRAADQGGLNWWADQVTTGGKTLEDVRASFVTSTEYTTTYGAAATRADLVTSIYQNLFERTPSADEVKYWAETDTRPADQLVAAFIEFAGAADQAVINNKTFVAQTYTDTVGATNFDKAGAAAAIANVDGTPASVGTAIEAITNGTLAGQVPGVTQINALANAQTAQANYETANKASIDALIAKLDAAHTDVAAGAGAGRTLTDKLVAGSSFQVKVNAVVGDAALIRGEVSPSTTTILTTNASDKAAAATAAYNALSTKVAAGAAAGTLSEQAQADAYVAAVAAQATAKAAAATDSEYAAVLSGLTADTTAVTGLAGATSAQVYSKYVNGSVQDRTAIDAQFKDSAYYSTFKAAAVKDAAYADALKVTAAAKDLLDTDTAANADVALHAATTPVAVKLGVDATKGSAEAQAYVTALGAKTAADTKLADAQKADLDVAAAKALSDAYKAQVTAVADAKTAVGDINVAGKVAVHDLDNSLTGTAAVKDVFYFGTKVEGADDHVIASNNFGAGDSIVLGSNYAFNNGALTTGDNNKLEFFLVKSDVGVNVVIESNLFGSSTVTADATTGAITTAAGATDAAAVITLTGVTLEQLTVNNGVISHVA